MYCSTRNCFKEPYYIYDNYMQLCREHYEEQKNIIESQKAQFQANLKKNLESLKEVEERIKARKQEQKDNTK